MVVVAVQGPPPGSSLGELKFSLILLVSLAMTEDVDEGNNREVIDQLRYGMRK